MISTAKDQREGERATISPSKDRQDRDIDTGKAEMLSIVDVLFSCDQEKTEGQNRTLSVPRNVTNKNGSDNKLRTIRIIVCEPKNPWA